MVPTVNQREDFLVSLSDCVRFIQGAIGGGGRVLVHSLLVSRAALIVSAYRKLYFMFCDQLRCRWMCPVMSTRTMSITDAVNLISDSESYLNNPLIFPH